MMDTENASFTSSRSVIIARSCYAIHPKRKKIPSLERRIDMIRSNFSKEENGRIDIIPVPDKGAELAVYIGRGVGYDLIQLDERTEKISATDIRRQLYEKYGKDYDVNAPKNVR